MSRYFKHVSVPLVSSVAIVLLLAAGCAGMNNDPFAYRGDFKVEKSDLADSGVNGWFIPLQPGCRRTCAGDGGETLTVTVLDETKVVDGVTTRVVEERETSGGALTKVARKYYAISRSAGDVYYFGEEVDIYRNGEVIGHEGSWLSGVDGARFGLMMPGQPMAGDRYFQEQAKNARDRAEIWSVAATVKTPAGEFARCVRIRESSALTPGAESGAQKWYAPGVGLVRDGKFALMKIEKPSAAK